MKSRIIRDVKLLGVVVVLVATLFIARYLQLPGVSKANPNKPVTVVTTSQTIIRENALPGTTSWSIPKGLGATTEIQAYASTTSVLPGHTITFYVSTQNDGTAYSIDIYRLGWYGGAGGRLMTSRIRQIGQAQGYYDSQTHRLVNCRSCSVNLYTIYRTRELSLCLCCGYAGHYLCSLQRLGGV